MIAQASQYRESINRLRSGETLSIPDYFAAQRSAYEMSKPSRFVRRRRGYDPQGSGADYHNAVDSDHLRMIEIGRDIDRNDMVVPSAVNRFVSNVLQSGFILDPDTGDQKLNADLSANWKGWSEEPTECDEAGEEDFAAMTELGLRAVIVEGDTLGNPLRNGRLEMIESHRMRSGHWNRNPNIIHGVELGTNRRRINYWVTKDEISPYARVKKSQLKPIAAFDSEGFRNAFHLAAVKRKSQTRGITAFAPIVNPISQHDDIAFAKLVQQQIVSCWAILRERSKELSRPSKGRKPHDSQEREVMDGFSKLIEKISPGMEVVGNVGETLKGFSPNVPNAEYFDHIRLTLTYIAINLDLPLIVLLMDASTTNFSGWRGAWNQAMIRFRWWQRFMCRKWHKPIYRWKVRQWMESDSPLRNAAKKSNINIFGHGWNLPSWDHIQPMEDWSADLLQQRNALNSPRRIQAARGREWEGVSTELIEDNALIIAKAMTAAAKLRKQFPKEDLDWREVLSLPTPDQVSASWQISADGVTNQQSVGAAAER